MNSEITFSIWKLSLALGTSFWKRKHEIDLFNSLKMVFKTPFVPLELSYLWCFQVNNLTPEGVSPGSLGVNYYNKPIEYALKSTLELWLISMSQFEY